MFTFAQLRFTGDFPFKYCTSCIYDKCVHYINHQNKRDERRCTLLMTVHKTVQ